MGVLLSALTVAYRDFRHVVPFLVQFWMFATPCIYLQQEDAVGPRAQLLLPLNPAYGLIANFRAAMLGEPFDVYSLAVSSAVGLVHAAGGLPLFPPRREPLCRHHLAEVDSILMDFAIRVENLSKEYRIGTRSTASYQTLREALTEQAAALWKPDRAAAAGQERSGEWCLRSAAATGRIGSGP